MRFFLSGLFAMALLARSVMAGDAISPAETPRAEEPAIPELRLSTSHVFESDFSDPRFGSQDATHSTTTLTFPLALGPRLQLVGGMTYGRTDFGSSSAPVPSSMETVHGILGLEYLISGYPVFFFQTRPGFQYAGDFDVDSFDAPTILTGALKVHDDFVLIGGVVYSRLRRYPILPAIGFVWEASENISVKAIMPEPGVDFKFSKSARLTVGGALVGGAYRVADDASPYHGDELDYFELRAGAVLRVDFSQHCSVRINGGWAFTRQFYFQDAEERMRLDGAPYVGISIHGYF